MASLVQVRSANQRWLYGSAVTLAICVAVYLIASPGFIAADTASANHESAQVVIKLNAPATVAEINATYGTTVIKPLLNSAGIYLLEAPSGTTAQSVVESMRYDSRLLYAEMNFINAAPEANSRDIYAWPSQGIIRQGETHPHDLYDWEWGGTNDAHYYEQPAVHVIGLTPAQITGGHGVVVAVLDTGIELDHPVLDVHLTSARYDFVDDDASPEDEFEGVDDDSDGFIDEMAGHGTHVAGIIHLVAPGAQLMPLRVLNSDGQGNVFIVAEALLYAAQHGAQIVNLSLGTSLQSLFLEDVLEQVTAAGVTVIAAAGNLNEDLPQYPAASPCALAVTAVRTNGRKASYASFGQWVDIAAPGERIYSTYPGGFARWSGTSMATPFVAGQAAIIRGINPFLPPEAVATLMTGSARSLDAQNGQYSGLLGAGRIDINKSLTYLSNNTWPDNAPQPLLDCGSN